MQHTVALRPRQHITQITIKPVIVRAYLPNVKWIEAVGSHGVLFFLSIANTFVSLGLPYDQQLFGVYVITPMSGKIFTLVATPVNVYKRHVPIYT